MRHIIVHPAKKVRINSISLISYMIIEGGAKNTTSKYAPTLKNQISHPPAKKHSFGQTCSL